MMELYVWTIIAPSPPKSLRISGGTGLVELWRIAYFSLSWKFSFERYVPPALELTRVLTEEDLQLSQDTPIVSDDNVITFLEVLFD